MPMKPQRQLMEHIKFVGKISKQGNKRTIIIPLDKHQLADLYGHEQVYVDIWPVYLDDESTEVKKVKKSGS